MANLIQQGFKLEQLSKPQDALKAYSAAIRSGEDVLTALKARASLLMRHGQLQHALADCINALKHDPTDADLWITKGNIEIGLGKHDDGVISLTKALEHAPNSTEAMFGLGSAFHVMGRNQDAVDAYQAVLQRDPRHVAACSNLSTILIAHGHHAQAKMIAQRAVAAAPRFVNGLFNLALCHDALGEDVDSEATYRNLLEVDASHERAYVNLGTLLGRNEKHKEAFAMFQKAIQLKPEWVLPRVNAGLTLRELGQEKYASDIFAGVLEKAPQHLLANVAYAVVALPAVFEDVTEVDSARAAFKDRLTGIRNSLQSATPSDVETAIGSIQPYYLAYHDRNNVELLKEYGSVVVDALHTFQATETTSATKKSGQLTVGIVTAHARKHSVWDAITKGIITQLDRNQFNLVLFSLNHRDECPAELKIDDGDLFVSGKSGLTQWISAITDMSPDVLIYPEIGMNHRVLQLSALRLVPRQYAMWGHPETSGLSTIDGYFSGTAYESESSDEHYVEKLIRLPGIASFYEPVASIFDIQSGPAVACDGEARIVCPSAAFKFQPENDQVFVDIVSANPSAELVFFHMTKRWISERFENRLRKVFSDAGFDFDSHVKFEDWMSPNDFHTYLSEATVVIDTIGFSGFNTAIQALEVGTPFIAYEGKFMRGRLGAGVLRTIGMDDFVADNREDFVKIVTDVVQDPNKQQAARSKIAENRHKLFEDRCVISAIEQELLNPSVKRRLY